MKKKVNVRAIRQKLGMTRHQFTLFGFSESSLRAWESGRVQPRAYSANLLRVIEHNPAAVLEALVKKSP
jgi:DNA-binding transcriptional regulator YiaG